jgi:hypothetical protein
MLGLLIGNIFVVFGNQIFQQTVEIPMGTNCAILLAALFWYSCEAEFIQKLLHEKNEPLTVTFNSTFRYINDVLSINNNQFHLYVDSTLYIPQGTWNKRHHRIIYLCFIRGRFVNIEAVRKLTIQLYDKLDDFNFAIVNFPYICSNIPLSPAYGVYISQLIRYARACSTYDQCLSRSRLLKDKLMLQGFVQSRLMSAFRRFYDHFNDLIHNYKLLLSYMLSDIFHTNS